MKAKSALTDGSASQALEWLGCVPENARPPDLEAAIQYQLGKDAAASGDWQNAERQFAAAIRKHSLPLYQQRLALLRHRTPLMDDQQWQTLNASVDPAERLRSSEL